MLTRQSLDAERLELLAAVIARSEQPLELWANVNRVHARDVFGDLGWSEPGHSLHDLSESLADLGLIERQAMMGGNIWVRPTYLRVVRATQRVNTDWQSRIEVMLEEWETATIEFKERVALGTEKINAEFAHDVISLANTKASGRDRYLVVGFSNRTREFATPVDGSVEQNRMEQPLGPLLVVVTRLDLSFATEPYSRSVSVLGAGPSSDGLMSPSGASTARSFAFSGSLLAE